jgi:glutamyl-tRNA reductase
MYCISVSFKKTPLEIRQQFALSKEEQIAFLYGLMEQEKITGGVVVSTCNRSEIYFTAKESCREEIEEALSQNRQIDKESIKKYCLYYQEEKAVRHLYKVACGLDSMVLGEDEILRQVKEAYLLAGEQGFTNSELNIIFQGAFNCAKLSKSETKLSNTPVSLGTLTANTIEDFLRESREKSAGGNGLLKDSRDQAAEKVCRDKVLVIGATGQIGSIVAKDLLSKGITVIGTTRRRGPVEEKFMPESKTAEAFCQPVNKNHETTSSQMQFGSKDGKSASMEWIDFEKRYEVMSQVAAVVSATASPHYTLTSRDFLQHKGQGNYLLIDLAVPFDVDKELGKTEGITLLNIDYFKTLSKENSNIKLGEMEKAKQILQECVEEVLKKLYIREFQDNMAGHCQERWFQKMTFYLRDVLDSEQLKAVLAKIYEREKTV